MNHLHHQGHLGDHLCRLLPLGCILFEIKGEGEGEMVGDSLNYLYVHLRWHLFRIHTHLPNPSTLVVLLLQAFTSLFPHLPKPCTSASPPLLDTIVLSPSTIIRAVHTSFSTTTSSTVYVIILVLTWVFYTISSTLAWCININPSTPTKVIHTILTWAIHIIRHFEE